MISPPRISSLGWLAVLFVAMIALVWIHAGRIQRVGYLSGLGGGSEARPVTALVDGERARHRTILPEGLAGSYHWLLQTDRMFARGEWRVRSIDYENAPAGRSVSAASPYRWWLGLAAWCDHRFTGRPIGRAVERAGVIADPLLHLLLVLGTTLLVAWRFGRFSAALTALGLTVTFPLATTFTAGAPDASALSLPLTISSALLLVAGLSPRSGVTDRRGSMSRWFLAAGVVGGLALWIDLFAQLALLGGVALGALTVAWLDRRNPAAVRLPWRAWAWGGAVTTLVAYLVEFAPDHLGGWHLASVHPLYAVAWLGLGEVLDQLTGAIRRDPRPRPARNLGVLALATLAVAAPFVAMWKYQDRAALIPEPLAFRLTKLTDAVDASSLLLAVLPLLLALPAVWLLLRRNTEHTVRTSVALLLGPLLVAVVMACVRLSWWSRVDGLLVILLAVVTASAALVAGTAGLGRRGWAALAAVLLLPGLFLVVPRLGTARNDRLARSEMIGLIERDLADWLAVHANPGNVVVLAPPNETTALCYYGGLRGVGSLSWENKEGVAAAVRILSAPSAQEAKELVDQRSITHLVLLSWDTTFDAYARAGTGQIEGSFRDQLRFPTLPRWLRPLSYQLPTIEGFEDQTVTVFAVVDEQDEASAMTTVAEYLLEMGKLDQLAAVEQALQQFPASLGAWVARADLQQARGDEGELARSLDMLKRRLTSKRPPPLAWEQRARLAVVLGRAKELKLAREQLALCVETADEAKLRGLSAGALYRLLVLGRHFDLPLEPKLQALALGLLPAELGERLK